MRSPLIAQIAVTLSLLGSLVAPTASAASARLDGIPAEIRAGETLEIRWTDLDADVDEVELELSLAGARWVRISPEMEVLEGGYTWRVPEGLAGPARIRLRAGGEHGEREVAERECFFVASETSGPGASLGTPGWWELEPEEGPAPSGLFSARAPEMFAGDGCAEAVTVPVPAGERTTSALRASEARETAPPRTQVFARGFVAPRRSPLRN